MFEFPMSDLIEIAIEKSLYGNKGAICDMCNHMVKAGGKRIRPLLVLYSGLAFSGLTDELVNASAAAELIHMASLVHDDIIDKSNFRRSKPSVNHLWGNHFSVLCGDYLFARAFGILSGERLLFSLDLMIEAIENMCEGEIIQAENKFKQDMDTAAYYRQISGKTAIFFQCCCRSGAGIGRANQLQIDAIGEYGLNMGIAFQIIDDILDFRGDVKAMGKPVGEDLRQGVITLPVILLLKDVKYGSLVREMISNRRIETRDIETVNSLLDESGAIDEAFAIADSYIDKARASLQILPKSDFTSFLDSLPDMLKPVQLQHLKLSHTPEESANMII